MNRHFDALIIGGGASGLLCAITAKQHHPHLRVAVLEKNDRVGKKLLATGNGRCNLTHEDITPANYAGDCSGDVVTAVLRQYDAGKLLRCFENLGLLTVKDSEGRYYPLSRQASAVLDVLRFHCERWGVEVFCGTAVDRITAQKGFTVRAGEHTFSAEKLVIASGSKAAPKLGGNGSIADCVKNLGHRVIPFSPALCPVLVQSGILKSLKGLRVHAAVSLQSGGKTLKTERGEVQFNEDNLSGICVFNLSLLAQPSMEITLDLLPNHSISEIYNILQKNQELFAQQPADNLFTGVLPKRLAQAVLKTASVTDFSRPCAALSAKELHNAAHAAKRLSFPVKGNAGFDRAQACRGGVHCRQVNPDTLQSTLIRNLYFCGEALDVCGECGGYNLHFAFAGGMIAGEQL